MKSLYGMCSIFPEKIKICLTIKHFVIISLKAPYNIKKDEIAALFSETLSLILVMSVTPILLVRFEA